MTLFTSQSAAVFYDKLFSSMDFTLPRAVTGRGGFLKEAMACVFIVMKCERFAQITDLVDYLENNRLIAHYCGFNIEPLPSYWTCDRILRQLDNGDLKAIMSDLVRQLYELGGGGCILHRAGFHARHGKHEAEQPKILCKKQVLQGKPPKKRPGLRPRCPLGLQPA